MAYFFVPAFRGPLADGFAAAVFFVAAFRALVAASRALVCFVEVFSVGVLLVFIASAVARLAPDFRRPPALSFVALLVAGRDFASMAALAFAGRPVLAWVFCFGRVAVALRCPLGVSPPLRVVRFLVGIGQMIRRRFAA
jgi:hypothetical protein